MTTARSARLVEVLRQAENVLRDLGRPKRRGGPVPAERLARLAGAIVGAVEDADALDGHLRSALVELAGDVHGARPPSAHALAERATELRRRVLRCAGRMLPS